MRTHLLLSSVVAAGLLLAGCSSKDLQDMNKGTDAAVGFIPPDSGRKDTSSEAGGGEAASVRAEVGDTMDATSDQADVDHADTASVDEGSSDDGSVEAPSAEGG
jgi:hypothetical protein